MAFEAKSKTVLVTGATGFIGRHLVERLAPHALVRAFVPSAAVRDATDEQPSSGISGASASNRKTIGDFPVPRR